MGWGEESSAGSGISLPISKNDVEDAGTWNENEIPILSKGKISPTGTWVEADIPILSKSKISPTGTWTAAEIPNTLTPSHLGAAGADAAKFYSEDGTFKAPSGIADATADIPVTPLTITTLNNALQSAGARGKGRFHSGETVVTNSPLTPSGSWNNDGLRLDGQGLLLQAGASWAGAAVINIGVSSGVETNEIFIENFHIDCNSKACDGVSNSPFDGLANSRLKFGVLRDMIIFGLANGQAGIEIFHPENNWTTDHCEIEGVKTNGFGIRYHNNNNNAGNGHILLCLVGLAASNSGGIALEFSQSSGGAWNRAHAHMNHLFCPQSHTTSIGINCNVTGTSAFNNRSWMFTSNALEDFTYGFSASASGSGGIRGILFGNNAIENKGNTFATGVNALVRVGDGCQGIFNHNFLHGRPANGETCVVFEYNSTLVSQAAHNMILDSVDDATDTFTIKAGSNPNNLHMFENIGYNPVGGSAITTTSSPQTITAGGSYEMIYIRGGTISDISKNGRTIFTNTGHSIFLYPQQSVVVTYSTNPTFERDVF